MSFESLPFEIFLLICKNLDTAGLNALARTCSLMSSLADSLLYQQAVQSDKYKFWFLYAVIHRQTNAVSKFLKAGVLMSAFEDYTEDAGHFRSLCISVEKRRALYNKFHPFLAAAYFGDIDMIRVLLSEGNVNIDFHDSNGKTALHHAIDTDRPDIIKLLLEHRARIGDYHERQIVRSPFAHAAEFGNKSAVELMFNKLQLHNRSNQPELKNAILDKSIKSLCEKACFEACRKGYSDIVHFLLSQGVVDVNFSVQQRHLLYWATVRGCVSGVKLLVESGARMESERDCGVVNLLFGRGAWYDADRGGPLLDMVIYLLRSGCNVANGGIHACALWALAKYSGSKGHRFYATDRGREEILTLLRKNGYEPKKCRHRCFWRRGKTSLICKMRRGDSSLVSYVEEQELRLEMES